MKNRQVEHWLQRAGRLGVLRPLDVELGHFLLAREPAQPLVALATALASQAVAQGHACLPLPAMADILAAAGPESARLPRLPASDDMRAALEASRYCASDPAHADAAACLRLDASQRLYLGRYARHEARVATVIRGMLDARVAAPVDVAWLREHLARHRRDEGGDVDWQGVAVLTGLVSPLTVITGGPGTGKTTTVWWLLQALIQYALDHGDEPPAIALAAPTGKAAARLGESLHGRLDQSARDDAVRAAMPKSASTLHRLLGVRRGSTEFHHDHTQPLAADVVVVDEASMIDLPLMARLLDALKPGARLILLGDRDQLASVEAGQVLAGICDAAGGEGVSMARAALIGEVLGAEVIGTNTAVLADAVVTLRRSHRFGVDSGLGALAAAVREGDAQSVCEGLRENRFAGVHWWPASADMRTLVEQALPLFAALREAPDAPAALRQAERLRLLTAVREGPSGCVTLNALLEDALRRHAGVGAGVRWYPGRLLLITANDPDAGLYNGDVGVVWPVEPGRLAAWFAVAGDVRAFPLSALPAHETGFAMTIHKSQGSEFDEVIIVLPPNDTRVLGRELLYTALTRARVGVRLVAAEATLRRAMGRATVRFGGLAERLVC